MTLQEAYTSIAQYKGKQLFIIRNKTMQNKQWVEIYAYSIHGEFSSRACLSSIMAQILNLPYSKKGILLININIPQLIELFNRHMAQHNGVTLVNNNCFRPSEKNYFFNGYTLLPPRYAKIYERKE